MMLVAACTESELSQDKTTGFGAIAAEADAIITAFPPLCEALRSEGYETRKITFDEADNTSLALAENACPDDIARLASAREVEAATAAIASDDVEIVFTACAGTATGFDATATFTNTGSVPVGVYAAIRAETAEQLIGRAIFTVVWNLEPGETATRQVEGVVSGDGCGAEYNVFLADPTATGDASVAAPDSAEISSDDPAVFYSALYDTEAEWWADPDASIDGPSRTEDLRSTTYALLYQSVVDGEERPPLDEMRGLCRADANPDDPGLVVLTIHLGDRIAAGVARRGEDGGWRWLGTAVDLGPAPCP